jgi:hypothetical protein
MRFDGFVEERHIWVIETYESTLTLAKCETILPELACNIFGEPRLMLALVQRKIDPP